ncbi:hypothetical protein FB451DRAFT_1173162 [Mycena latifolia]|nr:hypothetical protein FB451DRAFT_1173162 [Mycena latifolia]
MSLLIQGLPVSWLAFANSPGHVVPVTPSPPGESLSLVCGGYSALFITARIIMLPCLPIPRVLLIRISRRLPRRPNLPHLIIGLLAPRVLHALRSNFGPSGVTREAALALKFNSNDLTTPASSMDILDPAAEIEIYASSTFDESIGGGLPAPAFV